MAETRELSECVDGVTITYNNLTEKISATTTATELASNGQDVTVSSSDPPTVGQVLTAVSPTVAMWQDPSGTSDDLVRGPASANDGNVAAFDGDTGKLLQDGSKAVADLVTGPASATSDRVVTFDGTSGKLLKDGGTLLSDVVQKTRTITAGTGLTGGGDLSADRTLAVAYGSTAGTAAQGNDSRLSNARPPTAHASSHQDGAADEISIANLSGQAADPQKHEVAKAGTLVSTRKRVNLIEGSNVTITVADNSGADRTDVTFTTLAGGDVVGPASATDGRVAVYSGTTGKLLKDGTKLEADLVTGPSSAQDGRVAVYNGSTGKLLKGGLKLEADLVTGPASAVSGRLPTFSGTTGKIIQDSGTLLSDVVVTGTAAGGDLAGTYPNPTVTQARGLKTATTTVEISTAPAPTLGNEVLIAETSTSATWKPLTSLLAATSPAEFRFGAPLRQSGSLIADSAPNYYENNNKVLALYSQGQPARAVESSFTMQVGPGNTTSSLGAAFLYDRQFGVTSIPSGVWTSGIYAKINAPTTDTISIGMQVFRVTDLSTTVTLTGAGTTRTVTAAEGSPFSGVSAVPVPGDYPSQPSFLQTPTGFYQITTVVSAVQIGVRVGSGTLNESAVTGKLWQPLFFVENSHAWTTSYEFMGLASASRPAYSVAKTDKLGILIYARKPNTLVGPATNILTVALDSVSFPFTLATARWTPPSIPVDKLGGSIGSVDIAARADHTHNVNTTTASPLTVGGSSFEGTAQFLARSDHLHALPAFGSSAGTFAQGDDSRFANDRTASGIRTATTTVSVSAATAPSAGQVLTATSSTAAEWQTPSGGGGSGSGDVTTTGAAVADHLVGYNDATGDVIKDSGIAASDVQLVSTMGSGVVGFLTTPTSANLQAAVTDGTGSGALVFGTSPFIDITADGGVRLGIAGGATQPRLVATGTPSFGGAYIQDSGIDLANVQTANKIATTGAGVVINDTPPSAGQVLTASNATNASWQSPTANPEPLISSKRRVFRSPLPAHATAFTLANTSAYFVYLGYSVTSFTPSKAYLFITTTGAGSGSNMCVATSPNPPDGTAQTLTVVSTSASSISWASAGRIQCQSFNAAVPAGVHLWLGLYVVASTPPAVSGLAFDWGTGEYLGRGSTTAFVNDATYVTTLATALSTPICPNMVLIA